MIRTANPQAMAMLGKAKEFTGHKDLQSHAPDGDTWLTPRFILDALGKFDFDPCAAETNPFWVCEESRTKKQDGLSGSWSGRVFMNPPFSNTAAWIRRHASHGLGTSLVPASVETQVWRDTVWLRARAVLLLNGRTRFANPDGSLTTGRPLRSIALIAWNELDALALVASNLPGTCLREWRLQ